MRIKYMAIMIALAMLATLVSAQPFSIRANRGLNLRTAPSLDAAIADTVTTGTLLNVVGKLNRWLKIDRNGGEVWLADWTDYSRVESGAPEQPGSQPANSAPANVDNCCFVDRQCGSDQEWSDGYWAFQNGQCAAPAPSGPPANSSAPVDNCCGIDRQCSTDLEWMAGWHAYRYGQCIAPAPPQSQTSAAPAGNAPANEGNCCRAGWQCQSDWEWTNGNLAYQNDPERCGGLPQFSVMTPTGSMPQIQGTGLFVGYIIATLNWLKGEAPDWYNYVVSAIDLIVEDYAPVPVRVEGEIITCTARAYPGQRKVSVETCWVRSGWADVPEINQGDIAYMLAHEACHINLHEDGIHFPSQAHEEEECNKYNLGPGIPLNIALDAWLSDSRGEIFWDKEGALSRIRRYCSEGPRPDLFCPLIPRLEAAL